jgi:hypothetical protein
MRYRTATYLDQLRATAVILESANVLPSRIPLVETINSRETLDTLCRSTDLRFAVSDRARQNCEV